MILTGHTANAIESAIRGAAGFVPGSPEILHADNMEKAVGAAAGVAREGDIVVLSPACASFDLYKNFMERGQIFKACVAALEDTEK